MERRENGILYNDDGIPILELPEPAPVKPPKYTYQQYLDEEAPFKEKWDKLDAIVEKAQLKIDSIKQEIKEVRADKDLPRQEKKEEIDSLKKDIEEQEKKIEENSEKSFQIKKEWRDEQRVRWEKGFAGLLGIHYFYLTQIKIKNAAGLLIRPVWRDVDEEIFQEFMDCFENETDLYVFKRREVGLSSVFGGCIPIWITILHSGSTSLMTSADKPRVAEIISQKFIPQYDSLEDWIKGPRSANDDDKGMSINELDERGEPTGNTAIIRCRQTSQDRKSVTNLEGSRAKYGFLDELFLHPFPEDVRSSVSSCLMDGMSRVGIMVAGGSANSISRLGLKEARKIWDSSVTGQVRCLFLHGTKGISSATIKDAKGKKLSTENFCINGWSDIARAEAYIKWQRAIYDLSPDKKELLSFIKRYPLHIDEIFQSDEVGIIPKDVADQIPAQEFELKNNPRNLRYISLSDTPSGGVTFENKTEGKTITEFKPNGHWLISEAPIEGEAYAMGTDCIGMMGQEMQKSTGPVSEDDRSFHASVIKRLSTNSYVGIYMVRTSDIDRIYADVSMAQVLYNNCQNMIERNSAGNLYDRYQLDNNLKALAFQPTWIGAKGYVKNSVRGVYKGAHNTERMYSATFDYFRTYMMNVDFPVILDQLRDFGKENTDIMDAIVMCETFCRGIGISDGRKAMIAMEHKPRMAPFVVYKNGIRTIEHREVGKPSGGSIYGDGINWTSA